MSSGDPEFEAERAHRMWRLEQWIAAQPQHPPGQPRPDPIHVARYRIPDTPADMWMYVLARWSLIARLRRDAKDQPGEIEDLGPDALLLCQAAQRGDFEAGELLKVGLAKGNRWLRWYPPSPVEPVPGSPGQRGQQN